MALAAGIKYFIKIQTEKKANFKGAEYLVIPPKKYLSDALIEYGINLKPGIGLVKENRDAGRHFEDEYKKLKNQKQKYSIDITTSTIKEL